MPSNLLYVILDTVQQKMDTIRISAKRVSEVMLKRRRTGKRKKEKREMI